MFDYSKMNDKTLNTTIKMFLKKSYTELDTYGDTEISLIYLRRALDAIEYKENKNE